jgi:glucosamine kinase
MTRRWCIGIDGGGTGGRAWVAAAGPAAAVPDPAVAGRGTVSRPCNPYAVGPAAAADAVLEAIRAAWADAGRPSEELAEAWVCAGLAGVDRPDDHRGMRAALVERGLHPERLELVADPYVALEGALPDPGDDPRVLLVAGTGSVAVGTAGGRWLRVGGWGSRVGDEGSGAWLGIEAVRATLVALDGRREAGPLTEAVQAAWGAGPDALVGRARNATSADFATLAPAVLDLADDDPEAAALRTRAVAHLADLLTSAARRLGAPPRAWAHTGGVARVLAPDLLGVVTPDLREAWRPAAGPPEAGAWARARRAAVADAVPAGSRDGDASGAGGG